MSNHLSISSASFDDITRVRQVDLQQAFQRLATEAQTPAEPVVQSREVNLNLIFDRLAQVADPTALDNTERQKISIELRDMALSYQEDSFRLQLDSHVIATAQGGLDTTQDILAQMEQEIRENLTPPPLPPDLQHFAAQLQTQLNNFIDRLESLYQNNSFDGIQPLQSGTLNVQVGLSSEQNVNVALPVPPIAELRQQVKQLNSVLDFKGFQVQLNQQQEQIRHSQAQLGALAARIKIRGQFISTAQERLLTAGLQLRHISEAQTTSQKVGQQIRRGGISRSA